jgi:hypothetical protein
MARYATPDGWRVDVIALQLTTTAPDTGYGGKPRDGENYRVSYRSTYVADVRTPAELERYFRLGDLEEV